MKNAHRPIIKNLEIADRLTKLSLAFGVVVFYATGVINGPLARTLMILGTIMLLIFLAKVALMFFTRD